MKMPRRSAAFCLLATAGLAVAAVSARGQEQTADPRVRQARRELEEARAVLASMTNAADKARWEQRIELRRKALDNALRLSKLEEQERRFARRRRSSSDYALLEVLRTIQTDKTEPTRLVEGLEATVRTLRNARNELRKQLDTAVEEDPESASRHRAEIASRIRNLDEEILTRLLERDAEQFRIRLADEALRVQGFRKELDRNPRPTIRLVLLKRRDLTELRHNLTELRGFGEDLAAQAEETVLALELARERFANLDEEIEILEAQYSTENKRWWELGKKEENREDTRRLLSMLSAARSEKQFLSQRLPHLEGQIHALNRTRDLVGTVAGLLEAEEAFREQDLAGLTARYRRRVLPPAAIVAGLILAYLLLSRLLMPLFLARDGLFVSRRLGRYTLVLLIALVTVFFFLEDLKAIAFTMGIVGAAVVIALQDLCSSFAGWFVIVTSRKIKVGDRVEIDGHRGDVIDIQMLRTTMMELRNWLEVDKPTGRVIIVPNSFIFKSQVFNYSHMHPYITGKIDVTVTFESPAEEARNLFLALLRDETRVEFLEAGRGEKRMEKAYGIAPVHREPMIHTVIADSGLCYSLFFVAHYKRYTDVRTRIADRVAEAVDKHPRINFAYPTQRHIPTPEGPIRIATDTATCSSPRPAEG